jgi:hypothetical protein
MEHMLALDEALESQVGLTPADAVSEVLAYLPAPHELPRVLDISPEERMELARAHDVLWKVEKAVRDRRISIELAFKRAAAERKLDQVKMAGGEVRIKLGSGKYECKSASLRDKLLAMAKSDDANLTQEEIDAALPLQIEVKPNHTKLNYLARHRGDDVAAVIDEHRKKVPPDPMQAQVEFHFKGGSR